VNLAMNFEGGAILVKSLLRLVGGTAIVVAALSIATPRNGFA